MSRRVYRWRVSPPPGSRFETVEVLGASRSCLNCRSLHKRYGSSLCEKRRTSFFRLERLRALPLLGRFVRAWECDLRKYETVEDIEKEAER